MKIALLAARNSIHTVRWANALADRGHEVHIVTLHDGGDPLRTPVTAHALPVSAPVGYILNVAPLKRLLRRLAPDILHAHAASGYGTLGRLSGYAPFVLSVWGNDVYRFARKSVVTRRVVAANLARANWVCSTSWAMASEAESLGRTGDSLSVIPFGIDTERFRPQPDGRTESIITVGTVKALTPVYGIDLLLRAFAEARSALLRSGSELAERLRLVIVGDGAERPRLEGLAKELSLERVTAFTGRVSHADVPAYLNQLDVYVAASRSESFGVAVLEASACGRPVVVSNVGGLPEVVVDGQTGLVVEAENVTALATAIRRLVEDERLRRSMGAAGRERVLRHYDWTENVRRMEETYRAVVASHAPRCRGRGTSGRPDVRRISIQDDPEP